MDARTTWPALLSALIRGDSLTADESEWAMNEIMEGAATPSQIARAAKKAGLQFIVMTDHNVRETLAVTDRAYIINNGRIFRSGSPEALGNDPEVRRVYLGENFHMGLQSKLFEIPTPEK